MVAAGDQLGADLCRCGVGAVVYGGGGGIADDLRARAPSFDAVIAGLGGWAVVGSGRRRCGEVRRCMVVRVALGQAEEPPR